MTWRVRLLGIGVSRAWLAGGCIGVVALAAACADMAVDQAATGSARQALSESNGLELNGLGANGFGANGLPVNGLRVNGLRVNGLRVNGLRVNGLRVNGLRVNGLRVNGLRVNGLRVNGLRVNGLPLNGLPLNGLRVNGLRVNGAPLAGADVQTAKELLGYLVECALAPDQSATYYDEDERAVTVPGVHGLDPGWRDGVPDLGKTDLVAQCLLDQGADASDFDVVDIRADLASLKHFLRYAVECALADGDSAVLEDEHGDPWVLRGALGLAPGWRDGPMSLDEQELVSACLLARTNAEGRTVRISLRSPELAFSTAEVTAYAHHEGAFMGDLFTDTPWASTCAADGGGISGRVCTSGACGYEDLGACKTACASITETLRLTRGDDTSEANTILYDDCLSGSRPNVVNTYLNLARKNLFALGPKHSCAWGADEKMYCWGLNQSHSFVDDEWFGVHLSPVEVYGGSDMLSMWIAPLIGGYFEDDENDYDDWWGMKTCMRRGARAEVWCRGGASGETWTPLQAYSIEQGATRLQDVAVVGKRGSTMVRADGTLATLRSGWARFWSNVGSDVVGSVMTNGDDDGHDHVYVRKSDGTLWNGTVDEGFELGTRVLGMPGVEEISGLCAGSHHVCTSNNYGEVYCWGPGNSYGQQGTGTRAELPVRVPGFGPGSGEVRVRDVACGQAHTCVLTEGGRVHCWGRNERGQTAGDGAVTKPHEVGAALFGSSPAVHLQAAGQASCAQTQGGDWYCWGRNDYGQLGDGTRRDAHAPVLNKHYRALQEG